MITLSEISAAVDAAGTTTTLRYGTEGYNTLPTDVPAAVHFAPRIKQPASLRRDMFSGGTSGASRVSFGEMILANSDGGLDAVKDYGFDGRACVIRVGNPGAAFPGSWVTALKGTIDQAEMATSTLTLRLRDRLTELDKPLLQTRYAGNNALPNGLEGQAQDLKGRPKPRAFGKVLNVPPPCVNTTRLIYEIGPCTDVPAVYDQGLGLTRGADYASQADMETNAPAAGSYRAWPAGGYVRLGSSPAGQITADVTAGAAAGNRTAAQVLKQIALAMGIVTGDISAVDVTALDTANSGELGIWVAGDDTALTAMDAVAASVGAWFGFDRLGQLRMGRLVTPAGSPVATLDSTNVSRIDRIPGDLPAWQVTVRYARNFSPATSGLAGAVSADRRAWLAEEYRSTLASDASIKTKHPLAPEISRDTLLVSSAAADAEAARLLALYKVRRETYTLRVNLVDSSLVAALDLGAVVRLVWSRFGLSGGKLFLITGIESDLAKRRVELTVWG